MRVFIAIDVPAQVKVQIQKEATKFVQTGVVLPKENSYHITVLFLGEISPAQISKAKEILDKLKQDKFKIAIKGFGYFTPQFLKVIFAKIVDGNEELAKINAMLTEEFTRSGFVIKQEPYSAHITVARVKSDRSKAELISKIESDNFSFGNFSATSIKLMASELKSQGPEYSDLHEVKF